MTGIVSHLWTSTIILALALVIARLLPVTARTRHALLFCGLVKFAVPAEVFVAGLRKLGLEGQAAGTITMEFLSGPATLHTLAAPLPASPWPSALVMAWVASAVLLAAGWALARRRMISFALAGSSPASPREREAMTAARRDLGVRTSVDMVRSPVCEAPAVVRIIRPVVVLPDGGCDALDHEELESLLRHECAHVARRDNLLGLLESALVAAFWFHPLVWIAQRAIAVAREEACDEAAAPTPDRVNTYVAALSKICGAVLSSRLAGVSCMASAHLTERLSHVMNYELLRQRALSHRLVVALAAILIVAATAVSGLDATTNDATDDPFSLVFTARPGDLPDRIEFTGRVFESSTGLVLTRPNVTFPRGSSARVATTAASRDVQIDIRDEGTKVLAVMRVVEKGAIRQESTHTVNLEPDGPRNSSGRRYTGAPISLNLKDAKVTDVLQTFAKLTGLDITFPPTLEGRVTVNIKDMPWDQAFDLILRENRLTWKLEGSKMEIVPE